ncbi:N-6 DNA methylase [Glycomyces halotolerans]
MTADETITLTDLARLAGVGRNAVSNWRRREPDFPRPVDDRARRPRFRLSDIERWAAQHGRELHLTPADRIWFTLHNDHTTPDRALAAIAAALAGDDTDLQARLDELHHHRADLFEFFIERAREAAGTGPAPGLAALTDTAAACAPTDRPLTVHDPACDDGDLLAGLARTLPHLAALTGRDLATTRTDICRQRLRLLRPDARVHIEPGDSLLTPLPPDRYDLVVCDPPFNVKDWGHEHLPAGDDPRLAYGTPPRTEPELAWALHCLALLAPGGVAVVRMPAMVAHRRSGRRIRSELLRWGALRAVVDHPDTKAHIWVLTPRSDSSRLLVSTGHDFADAWHELDTDPETDLTGPHSAAVPLMRLWDEDVDISPAVYLATPDTSADELARATDRLSRLIDTTRTPLPRFSPGPTGAAPETSLADLERDGHIDLNPGPASGEGVTIDPVGAPAVRLGPLHTATDTQWTIACDDTLDPAWLAAALAARLPATPKRTATGAKRRILAVKVPRLSLDEQRRRGRAYAALLQLRDRLEDARDQAAALADEAAGGLVTGTITVDE